MKAPPNPKPTMYGLLDLLVLLAMLGKGAAWLLHMH